MPETCPHAERREKAALEIHHGAIIAYPMGTIQKKRGVFRGVRLKVVKRHQPPLRKSILGPSMRKVFSPKDRESLKTEILANQGGGMAKARELLLKALQALPD